VEDPALSCSPCNVSDFKEKEVAELHE